MIEKQSERVCQISLLKMIKEMYGRLENVRKSEILGKRTGRFKEPNETS